MLQVLKFVPVTKNLFVEYENDDTLNGLIGHSDSDFPNCKDIRKSVTAFIIYLNGVLISWESEKKNCAAKSAMEAEYIAMAELCSEMPWLNRIMRECDFNNLSTPVIYLMQKVLLTAQKKHINVRYNFVKNNILKGHITVL